MGRLVNYWLLALYLLISSRKGLVFMCTYIYFLLFGVLCAIPDSLYLYTYRKKHVFNYPEMTETFLLKSSALFFCAQMCNMYYSLDNYFFLVNDLTAQYKVE